MRVLILGGTNFVGRTTALEALRRGHEVTTFNRGTKATPEGATAITGDRLAPGGYVGLDGLTFDTVVDTWSTEPIAVQTAVEALRGRISHYIYISSISVYDQDSAVTPLTETSPLVDPDKTEIKYCGDKLKGELAAQSSGGPVLIVRPGLILGPYEGINGRLPWWLGRMQRGGRTLAPGPKRSGLQYIDARDLARFVMDAAQYRIDGVYNVLSKPSHASMEVFLNTANTVTGGHAQLIWTDPESILGAGIAPWTELPCWLPPGPDYDFTFTCNVEKAFTAGLNARPPHETIADTWAWLQTQDEVPPVYGRNGLDPKKEAAVLGP